MVFESIVTDVLNRVLGDYVENLDSKQLKLGIWGGDVVLKDLVLKTSALDQLNLPIQIVYGRLGQLVLKIPWKNLYGAAVEATIEGLYLLVVPNQQTKYNAEKEKEEAQKNKASELKKIDELKQKEVEKDNPKSDDTFTEKLTIQIIKNLQVKIQNIHLRYEDKVTQPTSPFAVGITLGNLSMETTDETWTPTIVQETVSKIFKVVKLDGLAAYWNCGSALYANLPIVELIDRFNKGIVTKAVTPANYNYLLGPIYASARLRLNPKPDCDTPKFSIPKIHLNLEMEKLYVGVNKSQYRNIIALADSFTRMSKGTPYRKYRPELQEYKNHYVEWWLFAYNCILDDVRRRRLDWSWDHMKHHRDMCRKYGEFYRTKLTQKKVSAVVQQKLDYYEQELDIFNIVVERQKVELDLARLGKLKEKEEPQSFWSGWWGGSKANEDTPSTDIVKQFEEAMTPEEKDRLYKAIGYQENSGPLEYPQAYVDTSGTFVLRKLEIQVMDDASSTPLALTVELAGVKCRLDTRVAASALKVAVNVDGFSIFGVKQEEFIPKLISPIMEDGENDALLDVLFETNPLDKLCNHRLHVNIKPVKIIYDAVTINNTITIFQAPQSSALEQLSAAAGNGLNNIKQLSATGLQHAIEESTIIDLKIDLHAPYILIPYGGKYTGIENVLIANLGYIKIFSSDRRAGSLSVRELHAKGTDDDKILQEMISQSYDQFNLELSQLQILLVQGGEDWYKLMQETNVTPSHLLSPLNINLILYKCLITDDPRLPLLKLKCHLPSIALYISDVRLLLLIALASSIPFPSSESETELPLLKSSQLHTSTESLVKYLDLEEKPKKKAIPEPENKDFKGDLVQFTKLEAQFVMDQLCLVINHQEMSSSPVEEMLNLKISTLECELVQQTFNMQLVARLGGIDCSQMRASSKIDIISTPLRTDEYLIVVKYITVDKQSPEFHSKYQSCETRLILDFSVLNVVLHQEGILGLLKFAKDLQSEINDVTTSVVEVESKATMRKLSSVAENLVLDLKSSKTSAMNLTKKTKAIVIETIQFKLNANLQELTVLFACDKFKISSIGIKGLNAEVIVKTSYTQVIASLARICIFDLNPKSIHSKILTVTGDELAKVQVVMYNSQCMSPENIDMSVQVSLGCLRFVFLNWYISNMLNFLNHFQTAQTAIIEASQTVADTAKQNVQNAYNNSTKISLNIDLKAPEVIIPVSSQSFEALMLDLGYITILNKFTSLDAKNDQGHHAVVDEMKLKLTDLSIASVKLDKEDNIVNKVLLLLPVTFTLCIKRNLSSGWYRSIADIDLSGKINSITVLLAQSDYQMIMSILNGNLSEGEKSPDVPQKAEVTDVSDKPSEFNILPEDKELESDLKVRTQIKFTLTMESFIINLFVKASKRGSSPEHDLKDALARFSLEVLSLKGRILSDNSIACSLLLVNCLMDDMRKDREGKLTRLMERKVDLPQLEQPIVSTSSESLEPRKSMIDVTLQLKDSDTFIDVRVFSFTMILSVDYLLKVAEFFTGGSDKPELPPPASTTNVAPTKSVKNVQSGTSSKPKTTESTMTLNLRVEKPDIILVEQMDSVDTNALILNTEILLKLRMSGDHQVINGSISDIQLYTCCYDPAKRAETKNSVLHPVSLSVAGSTPEGQGLHIEVCLTSIYICVSPTTIELLNRVYTTVTSRTTTESEDDVVMEDYSKIWQDSKYEEGEFWFLKAEEAVEAVEVANAQALAPVDDSMVKKLKELCIISVPMLVITVEAGVGNKTLPMLLLNSSFHGSINDWSSQLNIDASLTLQMGYYNSTLAVWEPLIETVEVMRNNKPECEPWALKIEVSMNETEQPPVIISEEEDDEENVQIQPPAMTIDVSSTTNLELTVTKTTLEVLQNLGNAFSSAINRGPLKATEIAAPYILKNKSGFQVKLYLREGAFQMYGQEEDLAEVLLAVDAEIPLQLKPSLEISLIGKDLLRNSITIQDRFIYVEISDVMQGRLELPVQRSDKRYFSLNHRGENNDNWGIVSALTVDEGVQYITLRSIIQVHNHFHTTVDVYYMTSRGNELECISSIEPGASVNIPLNAVYTPTSELFFSVAGYSVTSTPFVWKDLKANLSVTKTLQCSPKDKGGNEAFIMKVVGETEQIYYENTNRHTMASTCYNIHLHPAIIFKNCLPVNIICCVQNIAEEKLIKPGELLHMPNVDPGTSLIVIRLPDYLEKEWSCQHEVPSTPPLWSVWQFESFDSANKVILDLGMHSLNIGGSLHMALYCPFWMLNKTELLLSYRPSTDNMNVLHHPATFKGPILFSFNAKNFFGKKKASVRVDQGEWSDKFSLDVAGSSGYVGCKVNNVTHQIGVHNQLTYNGLTKQITFTPYYVIVNDSSFDIEFQEFDRPADAWIKVASKSCIPLWPHSEKEDKLLKLRVVNTVEVSAPFLYTEAHTTLLKLNNKYGGVNVDIQTTEGGIYINLSAYELGMAPALIINHTNDTMCIWEKETVQLRRLEPSHKTLYTWENPSGPRTLVWDIGNKKELEDDLRKDGVGEFSPKESTRVFWVSFLDGMQRILLFTTDETVAENVQCAKQFEAIQQEINVLIHGLGLSLVNNLTRQEIVYVGITSSGITWEACKINSNRFKQMNIKDSSAIESAYQNYLNQKQLSVATTGHVLVDSRLDVDFETGFMLLPNKRKIKRSFETGLWLQMKTSPNQLQLHAKINRLQVDNQMVDCIFPVVLAPVPPPKSVAIDVQKPFAELSIVQRIIKYSQVRQFKYFKVLIQEFHVKVDLGFVNSIMDLFQNNKYSENEEKEQFLKDMMLVDEPLLSHVASKSLQEQKNFYDLLHFSPLKVHVSFSLQAAGGTAGTPNFLNVLLQGLGVTLTDMQDVVFRLAYFEREYCFLTQQQLTSEAITHYVGQAVKQLYVLVLGLDVLGNPYGLVLGITKGVEDLFYEPFQGAIQGPGEFAEGLVLGVRSLFGHTVGGAAGAVSRITGALGKGIAALTFDEEYQHKRRDQINKPAGSVQEGIARGGKGLIMGVFDGVTGVFTKPISGAKDQGVEGFFKGIGKGVVGLVTRPTAGVIDFASGTLDSVKRATDLGEETNRLRAPRFIQADGLIRHYIPSQAVGYKMLIELDKGKYANTDIYFAHFFVVQKKEVLLLTNKRLSYISHNDMFGGWQTEWSYTWQEVKPPATIVAKGVAISTLEPKKKRLFGSSDNGKVIVIGDQTMREEICSKIDEQMKHV